MLSYTPRLVSVVGRRGVTPPFGSSFKLWCEGTQRKHAMIGLNEEKWRLDRDRCGQAAPTLRPNHGSHDFQAAATRWIRRVHGGSAWRRPGRNDGNRRNDGAVAEGGYIVNV